jgi:hypothetical protein
MDGIIQYIIHIPEQGNIVGREYIHIHLQKVRLFNPLIFVYFTENIRCIFLIKNY